MLHSFTVTVLSTLRSSESHTCSQSEGLAGMVAGLPGLRDLDICGCEQLGEDAIVALSGLRHLTALNVGSCQQAVTNRQALLNPAIILHASGQSCAN